MTRTLLCRLLNDFPGEQVEVPSEPGESYPPWRSHWSIDGKRQLLVRIYQHGLCCGTIHVRQWIETLHDKDRYPEGTTFLLVLHDAD